MKTLEDIKKDGWESGINQIWHGDCLDFMKLIPDKSLDLVVTDPPYGIGEDIRKADKSGRTNFNDERWDLEIPRKEYFNEIGKKPYDIRYLDSGDEATMLKRIYDLKNYVDDDIIITYGDTISNVDFKELLRFHKQNRSVLTIVTADITSPYGLLDINEKNKVKKFEEKPVHKYYIGTMVISKEAFEHLDKNLLQDENGLVKFFNDMINLDLLHAYHYKGKQLTFNTRAEMLNAEDEIIDFYTLPENEFKE